MKKYVCFYCSHYHNMGWGIPCGKDIMTPQEEGNCNMFNRIEKPVRPTKVTKESKSIAEQVKDDVKHKREDNKFAYMKVRKLISKYSSGKVLPRNQVLETVLISNQEYDEVTEQLKIAGVIEVVSEGIKII